MAVAPLSRGQTERSGFTIRNSTFLISPGDFLLGLERGCAARPGERSAREEPPCFAETLVLGWGVPRATTSLPGGSSWVFPGDLSSALSPR